MHRFLPYRKPLGAMKKPMSYYSLQTVMRYLPCGTRRKAVAKIPSLRRVDTRIPQSHKAVELSYEAATECIRFLIDNMVIKFHFKQGQRTGKVETCRRTIEIAPYDMLSRCVKYYLNRTNVSIRNLTISRVCWPCRDFFPSKVTSLLIVSLYGMETILQRFDNVSVGRVIIRNEFKNSQIFNVPMVLSAEKVFVTSVETMNAAILDFPMKRSRVREMLSAAESFFMFVDKMKLVDSETLGSSYTASFNDGEKCKKLWKDLKRRYATKSTMWNGEKCLTIGMDNYGDGELVITRSVSGVFAHQKHLFTIHVLPENTSVERNMFATMNLINRWRSQS